METSCLTPLEKMVEDRPENRAWTPTTPQAINALRHIRSAPVTGSRHLGALVRSSTDRDRRRMESPLLDMFVDDGTDGTLDSTIRTLRFAAASSNIYSLFKPESSKQDINTLRQAKAPLEAFENGHEDVQNKPEHIFPSESYKTSQKQAHSSEQISVPSKAETVSPMPPIEKKLEDQAEKNAWTPTTPQAIEALKHIKSDPVTGSQKQGALIRNSSDWDHRRVESAFLDMSADDGTDGSLDNTSRALRFSAAASNICNLFNTESSSNEDHQSKTFPVIESDSSSQDQGHPSEQKDTEKTTDEGHNARENTLSASKNTLETLETEPVTPPQAAFKEPICADVSLQAQRSVDKPTDSDKGVPTSSGPKTGPFKKTRSQLRNLLKKLSSGARNRARQGSDEDSPNIEGQQPGGQGVRHPKILNLLKKFSSRSRGRRSEEEQAMSEPTVSGTDTAPDQDGTDRRFQSDNRKNLQVFVEKVLDFFVMIAR